MELGNLAKLELLLLPNNVLTGSIPSQIFNISSLTNLDLTYNRLVGSLPDNRCQNLPVLEGLFISYNQLTGPIPTILWKCRELHVVSLASNKFQGGIPRDIGNLTSVRNLFLGNNSLIGTYIYEPLSVKIFLVIY